MTPLTFTSCQAPIADNLCREIVGWLSTQIEEPATFIADIPWTERERQFDTGQIDVAWICGTPYVEKMDRAEPNLELLAAPVAAAARYQGQPVYFSDVLVHKDSPYQQFSDLRGATWAYNEPRSHSGYHVMRYALAQRGLDGDFFGRVIESGAHQRSLQLILEGQVDASAIDSTVLDMIYAQDHTIQSQIRSLAILGPSPMPPWVIGRHVPAARCQQLRQLLLHLHEDAEGLKILTRYQMARFAEVTDHTYDEIRHMLKSGVKIKNTVRVY